MKKVISIILFVSSLFSYDLSTSIDKSKKLESDANIISKNINLKIIDNTLITAHYLKKTNETNFNAEKEKGITALTPNTITKDK